MPKSLLRAGQLLLIAAMFAGCGGHWLVLQSVAWGGMIAEYARTAKLIVAVEKTFDGQHPCGLCKKIEKGRGNEKKRDAQLVVSKHELFYSAAPAFVLPMGRWWLQTTTNGVAELRTEQPSVPPPRS
jgi:hypothetical protein